MRKEELLHKDSENKLKKLIRTVAGFRELINNLEDRILQLETPQNKKIIKTRVRK